MGRGRILVKEMPSYLQVLLRYRKYPREVPSASRMRTPIMMPAMVPAEEPV